VFGCFIVIPFLFSPHSFTLKQFGYHPAHAVTEQQRKTTLTLCIALEDMFVH
jgi:hypothetical protein